MDKSLELLNINSAGVEKELDNKNDSEIYDEAVKIEDLSQKVEYLKNCLDKSHKSLNKSRYYLASLIKDSEPKLAFFQFFKVVKNSIFYTDNYLLYASLMIEKKAWVYAKQILEAAIMICPATDEQALSQIKSLLSQVQEKISTNEEDSSTSEFKNIEAIIPNAYWVLEQFYYRDNIKLAAYYPFKLLNFFPNDYKIHKTVFKGLSLIDNPMLYETYISFLNKNNEIGENYKNLYLGLTYYNLSKFEQSIHLLSKISEDDECFEDACVYLSLNYLFKEDIENVSDILEKTKTSIEPLYLAISFISFSILEVKINLPKSPNHNEISLEINRIILKLLRLNKKEYALYVINQLKKINIDSTLPILTLLLAETFIKENMLDIAKELLKECNDPEKHRLISWIYRIEDKSELANKELAEYRSKLLFKKSKNRTIQYQLINIDLPEEIPEDKDEILAVLEDGYSQIKKIKGEIQLEYGINKDTCFEANCHECCTKTFPLVSFTEYLYMRKWLDGQDEQYKNKIYEESIKLVTLFKETYKKEPQFIAVKDTLFQNSYPRDYSFTCPFLVENKCSVYPAQPFICRTFGYSSSNLDGIRFRGCNYFSRQLHSATELSNIRKIINENSCLNFVSELDKKLIDKHILASIPVWFSHSHEEILEIIKGLN